MSELIIVLFFVVWVGGVVVWIAGALRIRGRRSMREVRLVRTRGSRSLRLTQETPWFVKLWIGVAAMFIIGVVGYYLIARFSALSHLEHLASAPPDVLKLCGVSSSLDLNGHGDVSAFLKLLASGEGVWGHHSHPVDATIITFVADGKVYKLGRDSDHLQEFWLSGGQDPEWHLRQFNSPALDAWLRLHWPTGSSTASTRGTAASVPYTQPGTR